MPYINNKINLQYKINGIMVCYIYVEHLVRFRNVIIYWSSYRFFLEVNNVTAIFNIKYKFYEIWLLSFKLFVM